MTKFGHDSKKPSGRIDDYIDSRFPVPKLAASNPRLVPGGHTLHINGSLEVVVPPTVWSSALGYSKMLQNYGANSFKQNLTRAAREILSLRGYNGQGIYSGSVKIDNKVESVDCKRIEFSMRLEGIVMDTFNAKPLYY